MSSPTPSDRIPGAPTGLVDAAGAGQLAAELGCLPLALAQAAAVIASQRLTYDAYLSRLRSLSVQDYLRRVTGEPYPLGAAEAIILALESVSDPDPGNMCEAILGLLSVLSPAGVSRTILHTAGRLGLLTRAAPDPVTAAAIDEGLGQLADASLLTFSVDGQAVTAHRLTMRVIRERTARDGALAALASAAVDLLNTVDKELGEAWKSRAAARELVEQIVALHVHIKAQPSAPDSALTRTMLKLRARAIWQLNDLGDSARQAIAYGEELLVDREQTLGHTHPHTLNSRNNLAVAYQDAGRPDDAIPLHERTLTDREQTLGPTHPHTLNSRSNLADAYRAAGRFDEASALLDRSAGPESP